MVFKIMNLVIIIWIAQAVWAENTDYYHGASIEFKAPSPKTDKIRAESFFGYSITFDKYNKHLIISSPTENENGVVYDCNIHSQSCKKINREIQRHEPLVYKHDYWFGATVKSGSTFVVACVPRFTKSLPTLKALAFLPAGVYGECYLRNKDEPTFANKIKLITEIPDRYYITNIESTMETLGWSMDIGHDDFLIIGGPGMNNKQGLAAIVLNPATSQSAELKRIEKIHAHFNFGYSVAVGYFLNSKFKYTFAVGSTYGKLGYGAVYLYYYNDDEIKGPYYLNKGEDIKLVGSMYGAVLCAANLHNTEHKLATDLLVGAPTYADQSTVNAGAVYVYIKMKTKRTPSFKKKIICQKTGSFFGSAIANVADLNGDGLDEIAIAAPYEDDGRGAVYLYSGADLSRDKSMKTLTWLQRLQPKRVKSFGLSLTALQDYDNNGCNELAIGVPYDNKVLLYNCLAAITLTKISAHFPNLQKRDNTVQNFEFDVCLHFKYPNKTQIIVEDIAIDVLINHPNAKLAKPNNGNIYTFYISPNVKKSQYCQKVGIVLPLDGNYGINVGYKITARLLNNPMELKYFDAQRVLLSDNSVLSHEDAIWAAECAGDKECNPILTMDIGPKIDFFVTGSEDMLTLKIDVNNTGEVAYDPCIRFNILNATLYQAPMDCSKFEEKEDVYECTYRKPLKTNNVWTIDDITLNLKNLTNRHENFAVNVTLLDHCKSNDKMQFKEYIVPLHSVRIEDDYEGLDIIGISNIGDTVNMNVVDLHDGKQFVHIFTITNNGKINFENLQISVIIIKREFITYSDNHVILLKEEKTDKGHLLRSYCDIVDNSDTLISKCIVDSLPKTKFFKILITMDIKPNSLEYEKLLKENVTETSSLILKLDSFEKMKNITTTIQVLETPVERWILLLAVLVALLFLIILIIILQMYGCLQRREKEKLINLKETVRQESVRRAMIHQSRTQNSISVCEPGTKPGNENFEPNRSSKVLHCGNTAGAT